MIKRFFVLEKGLVMADKDILMQNITMNNDLVESEYYTRPVLELTPAQRKLITFTIAKIKKRGYCFNYEEISFHEFCEIFGLNDEWETNKKQIRENILALKSKCFILQIAPGVEEALSWVDNVQIDYNYKTIRIELSQKLLSYYLDLKRYTKYQFGYVVNFECKYSHPVYEYLKSMQNLTVFYCDVEKAKRIFAYGKYTNYAQFNQKVLIPAIQEINAKTDITVSYDADKKGKKYSTLHFYVKPKTGAELAAVDKWKLKTAHANSVKSAREAFGATARADIVDNIIEKSKNEEEYKEEMNRLKGMPMSQKESSEIDFEFERQLEKEKRRKQKKIKKE